MSCDRFEEEMIDVAGGAAPSAGLEAHLGGCLSCRRRSEDGRRLLEDVDRVLRSRLREPLSDRVAARAASRLAEGQARGAWRPAWIAAAACLGVAILATWIARPRRVDMLEAPVAARSNEAALPPPASPAMAVPAPRSARVETPTKAVAAAVARAALPRESPAFADRPGVGQAVVLVLPGQDEALREFASSLRSRTPGARPLLMDATSVDSTVEIPALMEISPLEARPLADAESQRRSES